MTDEELLEQIRITLGRALTDVEREQAVLWLAATRLLIKKRLGDLAALDQDALAIVLVEVVAARLRNPENRSSTRKEVAVDDARVSDHVYLSTVSAAEITDHMWSLLTPDGAAGGAFSIFPMPRPTDMREQYPHTYRWPPR